MLFPGLAGARGLERESFNHDRGLGHGFGVAFHQRRLLAIKVSEKAAVGGEFGAEQVRKSIGSGRFHVRSGLSAVVAEGRGASWREMT